MRGFVSLLIFGVLTACADSGLSPLPTDQVQAGFPPGGVVDVIQVNAVNRLALHSAELIAPDGQATPASYLAVNPAPTATSYTEFPHQPYPGIGGVGSGNITVGPLPTTPNGEAPQQRVTLLRMVSTASLPLPDPVEYRRDWRNYRIRLSFGIPPGETEIQELAAPEPPPGG